MPISKQSRGYSTTFGTTKKWFTVSGAFLTTSSAISPSLTTSSRFFISIGVTEVIGSTPSTFTSESSSTKVEHGVQFALQMGNFGLGDRNPRQMRDAANGGGINGII